MGVDAACLVHQFVRLAQEREPTLADIAFYLTRPRAFCRDLLGAERAGMRFPPPLVEEIEQQSSNPFSLLSISGYLTGDPGYVPDKTQLEQYSWASNYLRTALGPFASNPVLRQQFAASESLDFGRLLYGDGRTVVLDCPQARYGAVSSSGRSRAAPSRLSTTVAARSNREESSRARLRSSARSVSAAISSQ